MKAHLAEHLTIHQSSRQPPTFPGVGPRCPQIGIKGLPIGASQAILATLCNRSPVRRHSAQASVRPQTLPIERVADEVGFGSAVTLRHHFNRRVRVPPHRYRAAFRSPRTA